MREQMVQSDLIECVIGLGPNLFFNSPMEACIIICRTRKEPARKNSILFINALKEVTRKNAESYLEEDHIQKIAQAYSEYKEAENFCRIVSFNEIADNNYDLSIQKYIFLNNDKAIQVLSIDDSVYHWRQKHDSSMLNYHNFIKML